LFFVVSGFIMVTIAHNASWCKFLFDRATRILPPYWFYTTLLLIASLYIRGRVSGSSEHEPSVWRSYLLIPDSIPPMPLLGVGWTLMHEMYFYFCFALIIFLSGSRRFTITSLLLIWSCAIICFNAAVQLFDISDPVVAVIAHPFTLEFIFGAAAAALIRKNGPAFAAYTLAAGIILCVAVFSLCSDALGSDDDRNWKRAIFVRHASRIFGWHALHFDRLRACRDRDQKQANGAALARRAWQRILLHLPEPYSCPLRARTHICPHAKPQFLF
jgi:peptidoglycan/LPS O-acetylase OafA/YrhL